MPSNARHVTVLVALGALGLATTGCGSSASGGTDADVVVVASTNVWGDIAQTIGGPGVEVTSFISSPGQDPHSYEANTRNILAVSNADVVIENGGGYDDFMGQLRQAADGDATVLTAVDISDRSRPAGGALNEHVWYDLPAVEKVADQMAFAFGRADPAHAGDYTHNAKTFTSSLDGLVAREATMRHRFAGVGIGITEPVPLDMLEAIGAVNKTPQPFSAAVEEGSDVSVSVLDQTLKLYRDHRVAALVYNEQTSGPITELVKKAADEAGIPVVPVTETLPGGVDFATWMDDNLDHLDAALSKP